MTLERGLYSFFWSHTKPDFSSHLNYNLSISFQCPKSPPEIIQVCGISVCQEIISYPLIVSLVYIRSRDPHNLFPNFGILQNIKL